ncbi:MAG: hypothetical protein EBX36_03105 [Planctomycetia bacterium]|nr:hypothetical protein [Planctomycetia bacterium]
MKPHAATAAPSVAGRRPRVSRRTLLGAAALAVVPAAAAIDGVLITPRRLVTSDLVFGAAAGDAPLRLVQVSDLHLHALGTLERQLIAALHEARADLIVITGDAVDRPWGLPLLDEFLAELPPAARRLAIMGNWEYKSGIGHRDMARLYQRHGVELLVNASTTLEHRGRTVRVTGLDDAVCGTPDGGRAVAGCRSHDRHLVLAHCPVSRDRLRLPPEHPATLVLAGHTHGGQVAPGGFAPVLPIGSGRYVAGWYRDAGPPLYVSRGIGTSMFPIRIGASPELVRIDWTL